MHRKRIVWIAGLFCLLLAALFLIVRKHYRQSPAEQPRAAAVIAVVRGSLASSLTVAGQFQPYQQVDLHAKVSGYIRWIKVDIGDRVRQGEVLAVLEVPELQDQVEGAQAEVRHSQSDITRAQSEVVSAESTYSAVHAEYTRLEEASKERPGLIAEQELDDARAKDQQAAAQVGVAKVSLDPQPARNDVQIRADHRSLYRCGDEALRRYRLADSSRTEQQHADTSGGTSGRERPAPSSHARARGRRSLHSGRRRCAGDSQRDWAHIYRQDHPFLARTRYQHPNHADRGRCPEP